MMLLMLVVSDTSPVLNLAIIGHLDLLRQQFGTVWLPQAVIDELRAEYTWSHRNNVG